VQAYHFYVGISVPIFSMRKNNTEGVFDAESAGNKLQKVQCGEKTERYNLKLLAISNTCSAYC
jgi:hypothetical protein